jgi:hypothetical protein
MVEKQIRRQLGDQRSGCEIDFNFQFSNLAIYICNEFAIIKFSNPILTRRNDFGKNQK